MKRSVDRPKTQTKPVAKPDAEPDAVATGSQEDYDKFIDEARALPASAVVPMRSDLDLVLHNVEIGVAAVLAERARLAQLPETDEELIVSFPALVLAVIFADTQIGSNVPESTVADLLTRGRALRRLLLKAAESLAEAGLLSMTAVQAIREGSGDLDSARDCIKLAALFIKNAAKIRGRHPITAAQIKEADDVGRKLLRALKPGRSRRNARSPAPGRDDRDRLWTLVVQRRDALWRAGAYLFGETGVAAKVPALQASRSSKPKGSKRAKKGTGQPPPNTTTVDDEKQKQKR